MKKTILPVAAFVSAMGFLTKANGQSTNNIATFATTKTFMKPIQEIASNTVPSDLSGSNALYVNAVNAKATKDFKSCYSGVFNEEWYTIPGGYLSYFQIDGYGDRAIYDNHGHWMGSLKFYGENMLPKDIRWLVRTNYFDFSITLVEEVRVPNKLEYFIHLEDKSSAKILRVTTEGDMEVFQEYDK
jgi:hypothetical protein